MNICRHHFRACLMFAAVAAALTAPTATVAADSALQIKQDTNAVTVLRDGRLLMEYRYGDVAFKPYVKQLTTPGGVQVLRDAVPDHKHHHGLMFAVGIDGVDFWGEAAGAGTQKSTSFADVKSTAQDGGDRAGFTAQVEWVEPRGGKTLLLERRAIEVTPLAGSKPVTLLTWKSRLSVSPGRESLTLTAPGHHYYGLGMRFLAAMDQGGRFFNSAGQPGEVIRGSERLVSAKWAAYTAAADGKQVTVAIFDDPKNPRHPNRLFTMAPFAYMSATLNLWKEPLVLKAGPPLNLRWGVALWDGEATAEQVQSLYEKWAGAKASRQ